MFSNIYIDFGALFKCCLPISNKEELIPSFPDIFMNVFLYFSPIAHLGWIIQLSYLLEKDNKSINDFSIGSKLTMRFLYPELIKELAKPPTWAPTSRTKLIFKFCIIFA